MFNTYEFTFAGESSISYGLVICDIDSASHEDIEFGNVATIVESRTRARIRPIHSGVSYHEEPLEFTLIFGSNTAYDRYDMQNIAMWLTGHQEYQWLSIDQPDMEGICYRCLITSLKPISVGWIPFAFQATVRCDCPYAYSFPIYREWTVNGNTNKVFVNEGTVRDYIRPTLRITSSDSTFQIINHSDGDRLFSFENLPGGQLTISVDNDNGIITEDSGGFNLYDCFNMNFFRLVSGDNLLEINGTGTVELECRFLYNTAG